MEQLSALFPDDANVAMRTAAHGEPRLRTNCLLRSVTCLARIALFARISAHACNITFARLLLRKTSVLKLFFYFWSSLLGRCVALNMKNWQEFQVFWSTHVYRERGSRNARDECVVRPEVTCDTERTAVVCCTGLVELFRQFLSLIVCARHLGPLGVYL